MSYADFIDSKLKLPAGDGFAPTWMPPELFDFQEYLADWTLREGCWANLYNKPMEFPSWM